MFIIVWLLLLMLFIFWDLEIQSLICFDSIFVLLWADFTWPNKSFSRSKFKTSLSKSPSVDKERSRVNQDRMFDCCLPLTFLPLTKRDFKFSSQIVKAVYKSGISTTNFISFNFLVTHTEREKNVKLVIKYHFLFKHFLLIQKRRII